ncbi:hypothetical protein ACFQLX_20910 [Streptomyces polyrhachis]|uniref:Uncharacterized protein n=1 Tax=Streptomyces polyrhachis TaxID=1282885 RepID=A0ABW2GIM3_9ACTN
MAKRVLLLGRTLDVVDEAGLQVPGVDVLVGTGVADVRDAFAEGAVDHVVMGAGLPLDARLDVVREIFEASGTTTVHLKDSASGPEGFLPFVRAVLDGLEEWPPEVATS